VWSIQNCQFQSDLKVLLLSSYDMILGLDWLEAHSPMEINWSQKWIQFQHEGASAYLIGILPELPAGAVLQLCSSELSQSSGNTSWPPEIQQLLSILGCLILLLNCRHLGAVIIQYH
jgi:hypothetical protein